jgi:plastocyanin
MRREGVIILIAILFGIFCLIGGNFAAEEQPAAELYTKVVSIDKGLKPANLTAKRGTTIIWVNNSNDPAEIHFPDKKAVMACGAPINFIRGMHGGYESSKIVEGGIASLCFIDAGKYEYVYKVSTTFQPTQEAKEYRGTITIE